MVAVKCFKPTPISPLPDLKSTIHAPMVLAQSLSIQLNWHMLEFNALLGANMVVLPVTRCQHAGLIYLMLRQVMFPTCMLHAPTRLTSTLLNPTHQTFPLTSITMCKTSHTPPQLLCTGKEKSVEPGFLSYLLHFLPAPNTMDHTQTLLSGSGTVLPTVRDHCRLYAHETLGSLPARATVRYWPKERLALTARHFKYF